MRIVFVGAGKVTVETARALIKKNHEVIIVESDKEKIKELSDELDCSFLHGDGSRPDILRETGPKQSDMLLCLSGDDQVNVIASLVGRTLGFKRVVTSISGSEFEGICRELGLKDAIVPSRTIARYLDDIIQGGSNAELSTVIKGEARFFSFTATKEDAGAVDDVDLPDGARIVCFYRDEEFNLATDGASLREGDEVVVLTYRKNLEELEKRWPPKSAQDHQEAAEKQENQKRGQSDQG